MTEVLYNPKIKPEHLARKAIVYLRQSSEKQVRQNKESQLLQYAVAERVRALGWKQVEIINSDLGSSAAVASSFFILPPKKGAWRRICAAQSRPRLRDGRRTRQVRSTLPLHRDLSRGRISVRLHSVNVRAEALCRSRRLDARPARLALRPAANRHAMGALSGSPGRGRDASRPMSRVATRGQRPRCRGFLGTTPRRAGGGTNSAVRSTEHGKRQPVHSRQRALSAGLHGPFAISGLRSRSLLHSASVA